MEMHFLAESQVPVETPRVGCPIENLNPELPQSIDRDSCTVAKDTPDLSLRNLGAHPLGKRCSPYLLHNEEVGLCVS